MPPASGLEHPTLDTIAAAYAAIVIERQLRLQRLFADRTWSLDLTAGVLTVGGHGLDVLLVAQSDASTWQWSPAESPPGPGAGADPLDALIEIGRRHDVPELVMPTLRLSAVHDGGQGPGHTLAVAACGLLAARGYFPAPYDGTTAWLLVTDERLRDAPPQAASAISLLNAAIASFPHANRLTVQTYLGVHGIAARDDGDELHAWFEDRAARFVFDADDRLRAAR